MNDERWAISKGIFFLPQAELEKHSFFLTYLELEKIYNQINIFKTNNKLTDNILLKMICYVIMIRKFKL